MNNTMRLTRSAIAVSIAVFLLSMPLFAQESQTDASKKAEAEMKEAFGKVPSFIKAFPEHARAGAWEWLKAIDGPVGAIPPKYAELIRIAVASQIPCVYCIYAHTENAKMHGATNEEIQEAVAHAAYTRHWSTIANGALLDFEAFKTEWDGILAHIKKQSEAKDTTKK